MLSITGQRSNASNFFTELAKEISTDEPDLDKLNSVAASNGVTIQID
jgi:hypothetical protein